MELFKSFQMALSFYSIIPVIKHYEWTENRIRFMPVMLPVVGLCIGLIEAGVFVLILNTDLSAFASAFIMLLVMAILTGGLHFDGLMDLSDAVFSRSGTKERRLEIMKDSRVGAFGVLAAIFYIGLYWVMLHEVVFEIEPIVIGLVPTVARLTAAFPFYYFDNARENGLSQTFSQAIKKADVSILIFFAVFIGVVTYFVLGGWWLILFGVALMMLVLLRSFSYRFIGGMTGDIYGSFILLMELALLITIVVIH
jgi:adenosylcobinamide-GDP ribazoletransferase